jgi:trigger factor
VKIEVEALTDAFTLLKGISIMRKKLLSLLLTATMAVTLVGCSNSKGSGSVTLDPTDTSNQEVEAADFYATVQRNAEVYKSYVTLGEYKGIEVEIDESLYQVTDDDVESYITSILSQYATTESITEGVTAAGDTIVLDYAGTKDGVAFSGGTATDVSYTIGSGQFIDDLDNGLVGLNIGEQYEIPCRFPDNYGSTTLAGQDVIFTVTVTAKTLSVVPELTDEWVAENSEDVGLEATTAAEFRTALKEYLENYNASSLSADKFSYALETIISNSEINGYPEKEVESLIEVYTSNIKDSYETYSTYYSSSGIDSWEDYISSAYGCASDDEFTEYAREAVHEYMDEKMVITLIAVENNLTVSADEIIALGEEWAETYGYDDYQEILDTYGTEMNAEVGFEVLTEKVQDFVNESVKVVSAN